MAKSDLLKEAIADAKAVRQTALANAKLALEEAFTPKIQSMLSAKLQQEMDEYEDEEEGYEDEAGMATDYLEGDYYEGEEGEEAGFEDEEFADDEMGMDSEMGMEPEMDMGMDAEAGFEDEGDYSEEGEEELELENATSEEKYQDDGHAPSTVTSADERHVNDDGMDLSLESIINELENEDLGGDSMPEVEDGYIEEVADTSGIGTSDNKEPSAQSSDEHTDDPGEGDLYEELDINEIISALREFDNDLDGTPDEGEAMDDEAQAGVALESTQAELEEAYATIKTMRDTINETNLLNAKLLFSNKLFKGYDLNEGQKVKVIENFDRAATLREVKLVYATLAESFTMPAKKKINESASRPTRSTKPTKTVITEGRTLANRFQKLAGIKK